MFRWRMQLVGALFLGLVLALGQGMVMITAAKMAAMPSISLDARGGSPSCGDCGHSGNSTAAAACQLACAYPVPSPPSAASSPLPVVQSPGPASEPRLIAGRETGPEPHPPKHFLLG